MISSFNNYFFKSDSLTTTEEGQSPQKFKPTLKKKDNQGKNGLIIHGQYLGKMIYF